MNSINKVLVTGGTGFVGHWMHKTQPDIDVTYLSRADYYRSMWDAEKWEAIVHLAPVSPSYVLQKARRLLFASSGAIYESRTDYANKKRRWEFSCIRHGIKELVIARLFTFVGEHLQNLYAITNFIEDAKAGGPIHIQGDGSAIRSYLYGEDLGRWMWKILLEGNGVYDVGSAIHCTILEAARTVADVIPSKIQILNIPGIPETKYVPDTTRARALGCIETVGLREAIERML